MTVSGINHLEDYLNALKIGSRIGKSVKVTVPEKRVVQTRPAFNKRK